MALTSTALTQQPHIDPERLAALLDGRLSTAEAAAVRAQLSAADDETLEAYADAIAISGELASAAEIQADDAKTRVVSIDSKRRTRMWIISSLALVAASFVGVLALRSERYQPLVLVQAIPDRASAPDAPSWGVTRGAPTDISDRARSIRVGALLTDVELASLRGRPTGIYTSAIATLIEPMPVAAPLVTALRHSAPLVTDSRRELGRQILAAVDETLARAGAYLEAGRIAAAAGDIGFFDRASAQPLSSLERDPQLDASSRAAIQRVQRLIDARPHNATAIHAAIEELLLSLAR